MTDLRMHDVTVRIANVDRVFSAERRERRQNSAVAVEHGADADQTTFAFESHKTALRFRGRGCLLRCGGRCRRARSWRRRICNSGERRQWLRERVARAEKRARKSRRDGEKNEVTAEHRVDDSNLAQRTPL